MSKSIFRSAVWLLLLFNVNVAIAETFKIIPMNQKRLATYYVQGSMLGSGNVEFMVDTGAGYTTINEQTLASLVEADNATYVGELTGVMADGSQQRLPVYLIKRLVLGDFRLFHQSAAFESQQLRYCRGLRRKISSRTIAP